MTLSRAFDELESVELATSESSARERVLRFRERRRETWEQAPPWVINPVKSRQFVTIQPGGLRAGLDALARSTMLPAPRLPVTAIGHKHSRAFTQEHPDAELPDRDGAACEVEVWKYEPRAYEQPGIVDPLSLSLSLSLSVTDLRDERVEQATAALMEQVRW